MKITYFFTAKIFYIGEVFTSVCLNSSSALAVIIFFADICLSDFLIDFHPVFVSISNLNDEILNHLFNIVCVLMDEYSLGDFQFERLKYHL